MAAERRAPRRTASTAQKPAPPPRVPKRPTPPERVPAVVPNASLDDHLAIVTRAVMQAGLSWAFIDARWDAYVAAFGGFDCRAVAAYGDAEIERILTADGVIRSRAKIAATIRNARELLALDAQPGGIRTYLEGFADYESARRDAQRRFAYLGDLNVYYWRFRTGAAVPPLEIWLQGQERDHPRIREMVERGRREGRSSERAG